MRKMTLAEAALTCELFDYELIVDGDTMIGELYCGVHLIDFVELI